MQFDNIKLVPIPFPGFPAPIWFRYAELIGKLVKQFNLKPISTEHVPGMPAFEMDAAFAKANPTVLARFVGPRWGDHGGIRGPHFHFNGQTYFVDTDQWAAFTDPVIKDIRNRLDRVSSIGVGPLVELDDLAHGAVGR